MKKLSILISLFCIILIISSCKKVVNEQPTITSNGISLSSKVWVTYSSGKYISTYGVGGVNFGNSLPHPTDADPTGIHDGEPILNITSVDSQTFPGSPGTINGAYFSFIIPTMPGSMILNANPTLQSLSDYQAQIYSITIVHLSPEQQALLGKTEAQWKNEQISQIPPPTITATTSTGGSVIVVRGLLIRDHTSPTGMSIISDQYVPPVVTNRYQVGKATNLNANKYTVLMWSSTQNLSGTVSSVSVAKGTTGVPVSSFNITYTNDGVYFISNGYILLSSGERINIVNSKLQMP